MADERPTPAETPKACPDHGPLVGVRYCPECASIGQPWPEALVRRAEAAEARCEAQAQEIARLKAALTDIAS